MAPSQRLFFVAILLFNQVCFGQPVPQPPSVEIANPETIAKDLSLQNFKGKSFSRPIKIAVLDFGYTGYQDEIGKILPKNTVYHDGKSSEGDQLSKTGTHGLYMANLVNLVLEKSGVKTDYELHLFNAYGITKFTDAVETVIREKFDVVLYSEVWEFGGNVDGKGFINALVDKAVAAGIIWVNAAGNFNHLTRIAPVDGKMEGSDEFVVFKDSRGKTSDSVSITCKMPEKKQKCLMRMVLSWNSFKDEPGIGTDKDLDLLVFDTEKNTKKNLVAVSQRNQRIKDDEKDPLTSLVPRELLETTITPGTYHARVKIKSKNFSASQDQLRITVSGFGVEMVDPTEGETILPPADNPGVIVVGASKNPYSAISKKLNRPDVVLNTTVRLKGGMVVPFASSDAAALAAGLTALYLGTGTEKSRDAVLAALKKTAPKREPVPIPPSPTPKNGPPAPPPPSQRPQQPTQQPPRSYPPAQGNPQQQPGYPPPYYDQGYYTGSYNPWNYPNPNAYYPQQQPGYPQQNPYPPQQQRQNYCWRPINLPTLYPAARQMLLAGGAVGVDVGSGRAGILVNYDVISAYRLPPLNSGDRLFMTPQGPRVLSLRQQDSGVPLTFYEIVGGRIPLCQNPGWLR